MCDRFSESLHVLYSFWLPGQSFTAWHKNTVLFQGRKKLPAIAYFGHYLSFFMRRSSDEEAIFRSLLTHACIFCTQDGFETTGHLQFAEDSRDVIAHGFGAD